MSLISGLFDVVVTGCDRCREVIDPAYVRAKEDLHEIRQNGSIIALATLITSVYLSIFGMVSRFGGVIHVISLPAVYFSYNAYNVCENLQDIIDTPYKYRNIMMEGVNEKKVRHQLLKGTFFFEPFLNLALLAVREGLFCPC